MQPMPKRSRALPVLIIAGKVSKGTYQLLQERAFDMDVAQYAGNSSQNLRVRCYFPDGPRFAKTPFPPASKHVVVHGTISRIEDDRCIIGIKDIALGPLQGVIAAPTSESAPSTSVPHFDWSAKRAKVKADDDVDSDKDSNVETGKRKRGDSDDDEDDVGPSH